MRFLFLFIIQKLKLLYFFL